MKFIRFTHEIVWDVLLEKIVDMPLCFIRFTHELLWNVLLEKKVAVPLCSFVLLMRLCGMYSWKR